MSTELASPSQLVIALVRDVLLFGAGRRSDPADKSPGKGIRELRRRPSIRNARARAGSGHGMVQPAGAYACQRGLQVSCSA